MPRLKLVVLCAAALIWQTNSASAEAQPAPSKRALPALNAPSCQQIEAKIGSFAAEEISKATQYFTPLFPPGPDGGLRAEDRQSCLKVEGACIVGRYLYTGPSQTRYELDKVRFIFGKGSGVSQYNTPNALFPCRTVAADANHYETGTAIYIPSFKGKVCPQNGQPVDGCFIVGDTGTAIKGNGRFDVFTGECASYDGATHSCGDPGHAEFTVPAGAKFYVVPRIDPLARDLRMEIDAFIVNGWKP